MVITIRIRPEGLVDPQGSFSSLPDNDETSPHSPLPRASVVSPHGQKLCTVSNDLLKDASLESSKDLEWYLEDYFSREPFATTRADFIRRRLKRHARRLLKEFFTDDIIQKRHKGDDVLILIVDDGGSAPHIPDFLFRHLHWELLEDEEVWMEELGFAPASVHVVREHSSADQAKEQMAAVDAIPSDAKSMNVLAITARPSNTNDIPHRLITRPISSATKQVDSKSEFNHSLEIVRPGTFLALKNHLSKHRYGYFQVVHLDVHGIIDAEGARLIFVRPNSTMQLMPDEIPAENLALLLSQYGVRTVVLNACRSAANRVDQSSNIAALLVKLGIEVAIGMSYDILSRSAECFMSSFYGSYMQGGISSIQAVSLARKTLRRFSERKSKFDTRIVVDDHFVPVIHCGKIQLSSLNELHAEEIIVNVNSLEDTQSFLVGREQDILRIESLLSQQPNIKIHLKGDPGVGKTAFLTQATTWWTTTGLYTQVILLQMANELHDGASISLLTTHVANQLGDKITDSGSDTMIAELNTGNYLIVIDSLESARWDEGIPMATHKLQLRKFLSRLKRCPVIFSSRLSDDLVKSSINTTLVLSPLDQDTSMSVALAALSRSDSQFRVTQSDQQYLEQLVIMMAGNPLAIKLMVDDFLHHRTESPDVTWESHLIDMLNSRSIWIDDKFLRRDTGARSVLKLQNLFIEKYHAVGDCNDYITSKHDTPGWWESQITQPTLLPPECSVHKQRFDEGLPPKISTYPYSQWDAELDLLFMMGLAAFWNYVPQTLEPFVTTLAALDWTKQNLTDEMHIKFRKYLRECVGQLRNGKAELHFLLKSGNDIGLMRSASMAALQSFHKTYSRAQTLLKADLVEFIEPSGVVRYEDGDFKYDTSYYVLSPLVTLVASSSTVRSLSSSCFVEHLHIARAALYDFNYGQIPLWGAVADAAPSSSHRKAWRKDLDFDFFNHTARILSYQVIESWAGPDEFVGQYLIADAVVNYPLRRGLVRGVLYRFVNLALTYITEVRSKFWMVGTEYYVVPSRGPDLQEWETACILELACTTAILPLSNITLLLSEPNDASIEFWNTLVQRPMFIHSRLDADIRSLFERTQRENSAVFRIMANPDDDEAAKFLVDSRNETVQAQSKFLGLSEIPRSPEFSGDIMQWVTEVNIQSTGTQASFIGRVVEIMRPAVSSASTVDVAVIAPIIKDLEALLLEEVRGFNLPEHRLLLHKNMTRLYISIGKPLQALEHHQRMEENRSILDPKILSEMKKFEENWERRRQMQHYQMTTQVTNEQERLEKRLSALQKELGGLIANDPPDKIAMFICLHNIGATKSDLGRYKEAADHFREAIRVGVESLPSNDDRILKTMSSLAFELSALNQHDQAICYCRKLCTEYKLTKGDSSPEYLGALSFLGSCICRYIQWDRRNIAKNEQSVLLGEAKMCFKEALAGLEDSPTPDINEICVCKARLSSLYQDENDYVSAERLRREVLELRTATSQGYAPRQLYNAQNDLAFLWQSMRKFAEAEELHLKVLEARMESFGFRHEDVTGTLRNLRDLYKDWEALDKYVPVLERIRGLYNEWIESIRLDASKSDDDVQDANFELAKALYRCYQYDQVEEVILRVIESWRATPQRRRGLADALSLLANSYAYRDVRLWEKELKVRSEEFPLRVDLDGSQNFDTWRSLEAKIMCHVKLRQGAEAIQEETKLIEILSTIRGSDHPSVLGEYGFLGVLYTNQGRLEEAFAVFMKSYEGLKKIDATSERFAKAIVRLADCHWQLNRFSESCAYRLEAVDVWSFLEGPDSAEVLENLLGAANSAKRAQNYSQAYSIQERRVDIQIRTLGVSHENTLNSMLELASYREESGSYDEAEEILDRMWIHRKEYPEQDHVAISILGLRAFLAEARKDYDRAIQYRWEALALRKRLVGDKFPTTIEDRFAKLVDVCLKAERWDEAAKALREKVQWMQSSISPVFDAENIALAEAALAEVLAKQA